MLLQNNNLYAQGKKTDIDLHSYKEYITGQFNFALILEGFEVNKSNCRIATTKVM